MNFSAVATLVLVLLFASPAHAVSSIDPTALDRSVSPCEDFYQYACGGWIARTEIPSDRSRWTRSFSTIDEANQNIIKEILTGLGQHSTADATSKKLGDFYGACMNEQAVEQHSLNTLQKEFALINTVSSKGLDFSVLLAALQRKSIGVLLSISADQDMRDAEHVIATLDQGGLSLPDRDYYLSTTAKMVEVRHQYRDSIVEMLGLIGVLAADAQTQADTIVKIETQLALASMDIVERRDPYKIYHKVPRADLVAMAPGVDWNTFFSELGLAQVASLNVAVPDFFKGLNALLASADLSELKTYLRWQAYQAAMPAMGSAIVNAQFNFSSLALSGQKDLAPLWKRCISASQTALGEAIGRLYVARVFSDQSKADTRAIIQKIEESFAENLKSVAWMDEPTKVKVLAKLAKINNKVGYPDKWLDYTTLAVSPDDYLANSISAARFLSEDMLGRIGKSVDRAKWGMTPQTVNAYYDPSMNEIVFPAAILQTPFFNHDSPVVENYGAIGMVMGHELTHGFDDQGRLYDGDGNLNDWWPADVAKRYDTRSQCIVNQYSSYKVRGDLHVNGALTVGENIADNGGIKLAFGAWTALKSATSTHVTDDSGFPDDQKFFLSFAQGWCTKATEKEERRLIATDPHSPARFRVNGPLANLPAFADVFSCKIGSTMAPVDRCGLW